MQKLVQYAFTIKADAFIVMIECAKFSPLGWQPNGMRKKPHAHEAFMRQRSLQSLLDAFTSPAGTQKRRGQWSIFPLSGAFGPYKAQKADLSCLSEYRLSGQGCRSLQESLLCVLRLKNAELKAYQMHRKYCPALEPAKFRLPCALSCSIV